MKEPIRSLVILSMIFTYMRFTILHILTIKRYKEHKNFEEDFNITILTSLAILVSGICINLCIE